jgi:anti-sigma-K factor RskA
MVFNADIHTLATPYALHALPDEEAALFEQHLAVCEACQSEVDEMRETATRLGEAASVPAPADLKIRVMDRIREVRPLPPLVSAAADVPAVRESRFRRWLPRVAVGLAAAAAVVAVTLGVELREVRQDLDDEQLHSAVLSDMLGALDVDVVRADADDFSGTVILSRAQDAAMVMIHGMDAAPAGQVYQLWFIDDSGARPAGFMPDTQDNGMMTYAAHGLGDASSLGVTLEPAGGSDQPTSDPVMVVGLPT